MSKGPSLTSYAWLSIAAAVVTLLLKMAAWWFTDSVGLLSDAMESLVNLAAAIIALISLTVAERPADDDHAYGHTKAEYFASGMEGALILLAAAGIAWSALDRLWHPHELESVGLGIAISIVASLINLVVARILMKVGRKRHSVTLKADGHHLMTDVWTTCGVLAAVITVSITKFWWLDPVIGLLLAVHIVWMGIRLVRESLLGLMDTALPQEEMSMIREILTKYQQEGVEYHALRTRQAGALRFMSFHLLVPGDWTVMKGHELAEKIEEEIRLRVERISVLSHLEPLEDPSSWDDVKLRH